MLMSTQTGADARQAPAPPDPNWTVTCHVISKAQIEELFFFSVQDVEPGVSYLAEVMVLIPADFVGTDVALNMIGYSSRDYVALDLARRDVWQYVSVTVQIPPDQSRAVPCLVAAASPGSAVFTSGWNFRCLTASPRRNVASSKKRFKAIRLAQVARDPAVAAEVKDIISFSRCLPDVDVPFPPISFGQVQRPSDITAEWPPDCWDLPSYQVHDVNMFTLSNAIVHGEQGVVTAGDVLVDETLHFANPGLAGIERVGADIWELDDRTPDITVDVAAHLMHGYVGNRNYAHWWVDVVPALLVPPFHVAFEGASLLWPQLRSSWQAETLALLPEAAGRSIFVGEHARVACGELRYVPKIMDSDLTPHPFRASIIAAVKERGGWRGEHGRKIYITRRDAAARRLLNEEAAIELLEDRGFEAVTLTGMRVSDQIKLFASASHVVGAHGAGLGNIMFCPQGAVLCEFQMMSNVQWSIRCLAAVTHMHYGCIMGRAEDDHADVNRRNWTIDLDDLQAVLQSPVFQNPTMS